MKLLRKVAMVLIATLVPVFMFGYLMAVNVRVAKIQSMSGKVTVQRAEDGKWYDAEVDMRLYEGDIVKTGGNSKVVIELDDGSITQLTSLSNMKMQKLARGLRGKATDLDMEVGKSWMKVKKLDTKRDSFNVGTPSAVAGVRGTYFSTEVEQTTDSTFDVFDGSVAVHKRDDPAQQVMVQANQRSQVKRGKGPSAAKEIPQDELEAGLSAGIGGSSNSEDAVYDLNINVNPPTLKAGETGTVKVQFIENGKPYNGAVMFTLSLGGSAVFTQNGSQAIQVNSDERGSAQLEIQAEGDEEVQINANVDFIVEE